MADDLAAALDAIEQRNEENIAKLSLSGSTLRRTAYFDLRRTLAALREALTTHPLSATPETAQDGTLICSRCTWDAGHRMTEAECVLRLAMLDRLKEDH